MRDLRNEIAPVFRGVRASALAVRDEPERVGLDVLVFLPAIEVDVVDGARADFRDALDEAVDVITRPIERLSAADLVELFVEELGRELGGFAQPADAVGAGGAADARAEIVDRSPECRRGWVQPCRRERIEQTSAIEADGRRN